MKKLFSILSLAFLVTACDPGEAQYGYYWNPKNIMKIAAEGVMEDNLDKFFEVLSDEALCTYGREDGMYHLRKSLLPYQNELKTTEPYLFKNGKSGNNRYEYYAVKIQAESKGMDLYKAVIKCEIVNEKQFFCSISKLQSLIGKDPKSHCL